MKKLLLLFVLGCMFISYPRIAEASFKDVAHYEEEIQYLINREVITGYADGTFRPSAPIKRIQAIQMILRELNIKDVPGNNPIYKDMKPGDYGYEDVVKASKLGIIQGKQDGTFDPWGSLTRGQMAKILAKSYGLKGYYSNEFFDVPQNHWAFQYVEALVANNITTGYNDHSYRPERLINRQHFALFMARHLNYEFKPSMTTNKEEIKTTAELKMVTMDKDYYVIDTFDGLRDVTVDGNNVYWENGSMLGINVGYIIVKQSTQVDKKISQSMINNALSKRLYVEVKKPYILPMPVTRKAFDFIEVGKSTLQQVNEKTGFQAKDIGQGNWEWQDSNNSRMFISMNEQGVIVGKGWGSELEPTFVPLSRSLFEKIQYGMTYDEIKTIMGSNGYVTSEQIDNEETRLKTITYVESNFRSMTLYFKNNVLYSKSLSF